MRSRYRDLARRAARRKEHHATDQGKIHKEDSAPSPANRTQTPSGHEPSEPDKPNPPVSERNKSEHRSVIRSVLEVLRDPPYWLRDSYMVGYRRGTMTLFALSAGVAAARARPHMSVLSS
jgi:hypothetical protein